MERLILGFELDAQGEWVAELACGHRRHVRHYPCLASQICPDCGVALDGSPHRQSCNA